MISYIYEFNSPFGYVLKNFWSEDVKTKGMLDDMYRQWLSTIICVLSIAIEKK